MKIVNKNPKLINIEAEYAIELDDGKKIKILKWLYEENSTGETMPDADWQLLTEDDKVVYKNLSDDEADDLKEYIEEINLLEN